MGQNTKGQSVSFTTDEWAKIDERVRELKLPARGGRSKYFQMLRAYDKQFKLQIYRHASDGQLHFYPEESNELRVAEESGNYGDQTPAREKDKQRRRASSD